MSTLMRRPWILFNLVLIGLLSSSAFPSGCAVKIKNVEFCRDKGKFGAICAYWLNAKETKRKVSLAEWNQKRLGMVCTSEAGMGNVNALIETFCQSRECVQQVNELVKALKE
jgi:hypothetical protein